jgi:hypothetical protein
MNLDEIGSMPAHLFESARASRFSQENWKLYKIMQLLCRVLEDDKKPPPKGHPDWEAYCRHLLNHGSF